MLRFFFQNFSRPPDWSLVIYMNIVCSLILICSAFFLGLIGMAKELLYTLFLLYFIAELAKTAHF